MRSALDTNVLVYAEGFGDQVRVETSRSLLAALADADVVIPLQCLGVRVVNPYATSLDPLLLQLTGEAQKESSV